MITLIDRLNAYVASSAVGAWFQLEGSSHPRPRANSRFVTELRAGLTTWAAMAYIISVNASILSDSGGPCDPALATSSLQADQDAYSSCLAEVKRELITTTAAAASLATVLMGVFANIPVGLAPGLGLNAYFAYAIVGFHGSGTTTYGEALAAAFLEGWIFFALSLLGIRQWLARAMPHSLVMAVGAGIGIFIAFIGLSSGGLFVIGGDTTNLVGLGGCKPSDFVSGLDNYCDSRVLRSPTTWLGIGLGGLLTLFLMLYRVRGALLIGIALTTIVSWPRNTPVTLFPSTPAGDEAFSFFSQVVAVKPLSKVGLAIDWSSYKTGRVWYALITFLYVDILDTTGTLYSMAKFAGLRDPATQDFERSTIAYCVDAFSISAGALMGTSPVTAFVESATGISEGARTGLAAVTTGLCFLVCVFFAPIFASIPSWATGGALVVVGSLMVRNVKEVNWDYPGDAVPAFLTLIMIPLTYNVAYGIIAGLGTYILLNGLPVLLHRLSRGFVPRPPLAELGERWRVPPGGFIPPWIRAVARGEWRVWEADIGPHGDGIIGSSGGAGVGGGHALGFPTTSASALALSSNPHLRSAHSMDKLGSTAGGMHVMVSVAKQTVPPTRVTGYQNSQTQHRVSDEAEESSLEEKEAVYLGGSSVVRPSTPPDGRSAFAQYRR